MIHINTLHHNILYTGDFSITSMFGVNGLRLPEDIHPDTVLMNIPNAYQEKQVWDDLLSGTGNFTTQDPYSRLKDMISKQLEQDHSVYLVSRSIPKHLDLFYFLNSTFPDIPVYLDPKSQRVADTLSDMGYQVYTPNIHISEVMLLSLCRLLLILISARQPLMLHERQESMSKICTMSCFTSRKQLFILKKTLHIPVISMSKDQVIIMVKVSISTQSHNISIIILIIRGTHHEQYKSLPGCTSVSRQ